jgi:hypothetical protein
MVYKPLSDAWNRHLGGASRSVTAADDEVADLPGGVFFSAERDEDAAGSPPGLYYKDATEVVRRVRFTRNGRFEFAALPASGRFRAVVEVLFVPEVDPRAWAAARELATRPLPELSALPPGAFFTGLGASEHPSSQRLGVYRLGNDGMFRRLLKDPTRGLKWSDTIPSNRFGHFGQRLAVHQE